MNIGIPVSEIIQNDFTELRDFAPKTKWHNGNWYPMTPEGNKKRINDLNNFIERNGI